MKSTEQNGFNEAWARSTPFIEKALAKSGREYTVEDVLRQVQDNHAIFFPVENGAAVFKVALYPQRRFLRIWLYGGTTDTGRANLDAIMEAADYYAAEHECDGIELVGRKGWEKVLRPYGYKYKSVTLVKDLGE
tara:strand:- start:9454 stop:9855 length:402 start_codon:yes stop_codon:yes gene_type:complete